MIALAKGRLAANGCPASGKIRRAFVQRIEFLDELCWSLKVLTVERVNERTLGLGEVAGHDGVGLFVAFSEAYLRPQRTCEIHRRAEGRFGIHITW